jgi:hypothetical protein
MNSISKFHHFFFAFGIVLAAVTSCGVEEPISVFRIEIKLSKIYDSGSVILSGSNGEVLELPLIFNGSTALAEVKNPTTSYFDATVELITTISPVHWETTVSQIERAYFSQLASNERHTFYSTSNEQCHWETYHQFYKNQLGGIYVSLRIDECQPQLEVKVGTSPTYIPYFFFDNCYHSPDGELLDCSYLECVGCETEFDGSLHLNYAPLYYLCQVDQLDYWVNMYFFKNGQEYYLGYF